MLSAHKARSQLIIACFVSLGLYVVTAYLIERHNTGPLLTAYFLLFVIYGWAIRKKDSLTAETIDWLTWSGFLFRAALLFSVPSLSDDVYRFIWDGRLLAAGYHPFAEVPSWYMQEGQEVRGLTRELFDQLNSPDRFTSYPPVCQFFYWLSAALFPHSVYGSIITLKIILLAFEAGNILLLRKSLATFNRPAANVLIYALNPLVILEISGNVHFEGVMIFFLFLALVTLRRGSRGVSSLTFALSVCTKLIPLIFLPLLVRYLGWKKAMVFGLLTGFFIVALFAPFLTQEFLSGMTTSLGYYFQRFEFNASLYYIVREVGYLIAGFNIIQYAGPAIAGAAAIAILYVSLRRLPKTFPGAIDHRIFGKMMWCLLIYFLSTTILHPWYVITLLSISMFTTFRFPVVWTGLIFLTYAGYTEKGFDENLVLVAVEYVLLFVYLFYEVLWRKREHLV